MCLPHNESGHLAAQAAADGLRVVDFSEDHQLNLGLGKAEGELWTCDLSEDYIRINGHYRT